MTILIIIVVLLIAYYIFTFFRQKGTATLLTQEEFIKGYRKAQLVDVREPREFANGYIRGARNIPMTQLKQSINAFVRINQFIFIVKIQAVHFVQHKF